MESWFNAASMIFGVFSVLYFGSIIFYSRVKYLSKRKSMVSWIKAFFLLSTFSFMAELFLALTCIFQVVFDADFVLGTNFEMKIAMNVITFLIVFYLWNQFLKMVRLDKETESRFSDGN